MKNKKAISKEKSSLVRSSAAEYLTLSELEENSVIRNFRITAKDGKNSQTFLIHLAFSLVDFTFIKVN
jgi:hypothetical protein